MNTTGWRKWWMEARDVAGMQLKPFACIAFVLFGVYFASVFLPPGLVTYLAVLPPAVLIFLTALARVNDLGPEFNGLRWHVRRAGLVAAATGAVMLVVAPWTGEGMVVKWRMVVLAWGVGLAWLTTPGLPPWEYYILGHYRQPREDGTIPGAWEAWKTQWTGRGRRRGDP